MPVAASPVDLRIWRLLLAVTILAALYFLREVIVPIAIAALITFLLTPLVSRLQRWVGRTPAVLLGVGITFAALGIFAWISITQMLDLAWKLPTYKENLRAKMQTFTSAGSGPFSNISEMIQDLEKESAEPLPNSKTTSRIPAVSPKQPATAVPVKVVEATESSLKSLATFIGPVVAPLASAGVILILVIFMLFKRDDLRDRIIGLVGRGHISETTGAMAEATTRVNSFLLMQAIVNVTYGIPVGIGLYFIGVPNAALWGVLAIVLRFIPYVGPLIAMTFPIALSLAVFDNWTGPLMTIGLFVTLELISNNIIEPWLYGASTGISSFALIVAAIFWTWLWGALGLVLSTPLTVCLLVMGKHVPGLGFISMILREEAALTPCEVCYHRVLAVDQLALQQFVDEDLKKNGLESVYSSTLLPALALVEGDYQRGSVDDERHQAALQSIREVMEEVEAKINTKSASNDEKAPASTEPLPLALNVVCVPVETFADEISATMLTDLLHMHHFDASVISSKLSIGEVGAAVASKKPDLVWLCSVNPRGIARCRQLCGELHQDLPDARILVGIWRPQKHISEAMDRIKAAGAEGVVTTYEEALIRSESLRCAQEDGYLPAPIPDNEAERIAALIRMQLLNVDQNELFDRVTAELTKIFEVPIALVTLVDTERQIFASQCGLPESLASDGGTAREVSVCGHVVAGNRPFVIDDLARDPRFAGNPLLRQQKLRFYAGVPLRTSNGYAVGSLCILDTRPRKISEREVRLMQVIAESLMREIEASSATLQSSPA